MHLASTEGNEPMVSVLLHLKMDPDARNRRGCTPLHCAAVINRETVVATLLAAHADVNAANWKGRTALHEAGTHGHIDVVETLLRHRGIDLALLDDDNRTAFEATRLAGEGVCASVIWDRLGRPGKRLDVPPKPKTRMEQDMEFLKLLWDTYCEYRTEPFLPGLKRCAEPEEFSAALRSLQGVEETPVKPEDDFVIRKGVRVYLKDNPSLQKAIKDRADRGAGA